MRVTACLLHNEPTSCSSLARLSSLDEWSRSESESEQGEHESVGADAKLCDLSMGRLKVW